MPQTKKQWQRATKNTETQKTNEDSNLRSKAGSYEGKSKGKRAAVKWSWVSSTITIGMRLEAQRLHTKMHHNSVKLGIYQAMKVGGWVGVRIYRGG